MELFSVWLASWSNVRVVPVRPAFSHRLFNGGSRCSSPVLQRGLLDRGPLRRGTVFFGYHVCFIGMDTSCELALGSPITTHSSSSSDISVFNRVSRAASVRAAGTTAALEVGITLIGFYNNPLFRRASRSRCSCARCCIYSSKAASPFVVLNSILSIMDRLLVR